MRLCGLSEIPFWLRLPQTGRRVLSIADRRNDAKTLTPRRRGELHEWTTPKTLHGDPRERVSNGRTHKQRAATNSSGYMRPSSPDGP